LARPGGNATGFTQFEFALCGKWLELLKQIAPHISRVAVLRHPTNAASIAQYSSIQAAASSRPVELFPIEVRNPAAIERGIGVFVRGMNNRLILTQRPSSDLNRDLIISLAARHKLPAVYALRYYVVAGGLISYGPDRVDAYRRAAG
jgi:putative ABC transport system substrate-binding protein